MKQQENLLFRIDQQHDELLEKINELDRLITTVLHDWSGSKVTASPLPEESLVEQFETCSSALMEDSSESKVY